MQPIAEKLGMKWQAKILFNPAIEPAQSGGCGSGGCGSGGCGA